jgi:hypothetical protein
VIEALKWLIAAGTLVVCVGIGAATCASSPRANCYTCVERCHPFRVSACEPSWSRVAPLYCSCDPFTRVDEPPATIGPVKGK